MSKGVTLISFFTLTPLVLLTSLFTLWNNSKGRVSEVLSSAAAQPETTLSLPQSANISIFASVGVEDARPIIIRKYLNKYSSPLEPYSELMVEISDKYLLDYRLLTAIAHQESSLCKFIPSDSHNCWGFGIYGDKVTRFDNYPQAIEIVAKTLKKNYIDQGLNTPEKIMAKYTPPSIEKGGPWAKAVSQFLSDLE